MRVEMANLAMVSGGAGMRWKGVFHGEVDRALWLMVARAWGGRLGRPQASRMGGSGGGGCRGRDACARRRRRKWGEGSTGHHRRPRHPRCGYGTLAPVIGLFYDGNDIPMDCKRLLTYQDVTHPECHVVLFDLLEPNKWYLKVVAGEGDHRWSRYKYDLGNYEVPGEPVVTKRIIYSVAAVQGELFFISSHEDMCAITFSTPASEPEFQYFDACLVAFPDEMCSGRTWLVENDGDLFLVSIFLLISTEITLALSMCTRWISRPKPGVGCMTLETPCSSWRMPTWQPPGAYPASPLGLKGNQIYFMKNLMADDADLCIFDIGSETREINQVHQHEELPQTFLDCTTYTN
ncbi:hypothetical protein BS78_K062200 [Paspalum vaginatum]|uniref:DUF295 domain-containing protein n=1 Tax=Paspalum vaginatum TaxID=158149 RepID=A0A9W7X9E4_9POAL|nr:hypothetical protein BS78_K062200 [Paspalum vaginatum]